MGVKSHQGNSWFGCFALFMSSALSFYNLALHHTMIGPIIPVLRNVYNATYQNRNGVPMPENIWLLLLSLTISIMLVGAFLGGFTLKLMLNYFSRKHYLQLSHILNILGCLTIALAGGLAGSYEAVIIGRFLIGFTIGIYYSLVPLTVVEMCSRGSQVVWQSTGSIAISFGLVCGPVFSHPKVLGTEYLWPVAITFPCIPSIMYLMASLWIPETPLYLVREGRNNEAVEALQKLRTGNEADIQHELSEIEDEVNTNTTVIGVKEVFSTKQYRRQLVAVAVVYGGLALTGINHLLFYTDQILLSAGIKQEHVTSATVGVFGIQFVFVFAGPKLVDYFGSLKVNKASTIILIFAMILFTISQAAHGQAPHVMPYIALVSVGIFLVGFFAGIQLSTLVLLGELTTEASRPSVLALGSTILWIMAWTTGFVPPYLEVGLGAYAMVIWIGASILFLLVQIFYLPDTKGKSTDQIQEHFKK